MERDNVSVDEIGLMMARMFSYYEIAKHRKIEADGLKHHLFNYFGWPAERNYPGAINNMLEAPWKVLQDNSAEYGCVVDTNFGGIKRIITHVNISTRGDTAIILGQDKNHEIFCAVLSTKMLVKDEDA